MNCFFCGNPATHFCDSCGHWLCDRGACGQAAASSSPSSARQKAAFVVHHPVRASRILFSGVPSWVNLTPGRK